MKIEPKQMVAIVTAIGVVGVTIYAIKKYYDSKKQDEQSIDLDEAKRMVKEDERRIENLVENEGVLSERAIRDLRNLSSDDMEDVKFGARDSAHYDPNHHGQRYSKGPDVLSEDQMEELVDDARDQANYNSSFVSSKTITESERRIGFKPEELAATEEEEEEDEAWYEGPDPQEIQDSKGYFEEDKDVIDELRYQPNSSEAREQFINMELANLGRDNDTRDIVAMLYDHPFVPTCDEDQNLKTRLIDHRIKFFGLGSRWSNDVSFGDVIMYYGKAAEFNCGNDVRYWVDYFLTCADLNDITLTSDEFDERIALLNNHVFFNQELQSHGLFGLNSQQMTEACAISKKRIDEKVTYDIEFHQFVQGAIE